MSLPQLALPQPQAPLPRPRTAPRPAPKKRKRSYGRLALGGLAWVAVLASTFMLVERQTQIQREMQAMTDLTAQVRLLDQQIQETVGRSVQATSVEEIESWAVAHGMNRPTAVKALEGDPSAVASRPQPTPKVAAAANEEGFAATARTLLESLFAPLSAKGK